MPEYLAPGVFVEEVSYRSKSIEGVGTTTTAFVGPTRYGPLDLPLEIVTSLVEFERTYGDRHRLEYGAIDTRAYVASEPTHNYMWHAARAFFENGGKRLYISRVFLPLGSDSGEVPQPFQDANGNDLAPDGCAFVAIPAIGVGSNAAADADHQITFSARFPGAASGRRVRVSLALGQNVLVKRNGANRVNGLLDRDVVWIDSTPVAPASPPDPEPFYRTEQYEDPTTGLPRWQFHDAGGGVRKLEDLTAGTDAVRIVTAILTVYPADPDGITQVWADLPLDPAHERSGLPDSIFGVFAAEPDNRSSARTIPIVVKAGAKLTNGLDILLALEKYSLGQVGDIEAGLAAEAGFGLGSPPNLDELGSVDHRSIDLLLTGGNDGQRPTFNEYEGQINATTNTRTGLVAFEDLDEVAIVAAPGSTAGYETDALQENGLTIVELLIAHCERMRYRIAVVDSGDGQSLSAVRAMRAQIDSSYAAFYYPWVEILDPVTQREIPLPPSGFVAGIYARNDINRAVYKAPANEVVTLALGFEKLISKAQQEILNPEGINCFRFFEGRGYRLWGARTASSDPEWKYVNLRRYFAYLEHSIDKGTQWAVFEPNGELLWANVRRTISDFLFNEFQMGALLGEKPEVAYFVKCDRTTMTQNDLDNGRLVCLIGVAPLRPAEFVIFRIGQWTADAKR